MNPPNDRAFLTVVNGACLGGAASPKNIEIEVTRFAGEVDNAGMLVH